MASFQLQTHLLHRFSLGFSWMSATALTLEGEERLISKFKQCLCSRKMSITNEHIHYVTCQILHMLRYHEKLFQAFFKITPINLLRTCEDWRKPWQTLSSQTVRPLCLHTPVDIVSMIKVISLSLLSRAKKTHQIEMDVEFKGW